MSAFGKSSIVKFEFNTDIREGFPLLFDDTSLAFYLNMRAKTLWWLINKRNQKTAYNCFAIPQFNSDGSIKKMREIQEPEVFAKNGVNSLKAVHNILNNLFSSIKVDDCISAYVKGKNCAATARKHVRSSYRSDLISEFGLYEAALREKAYTEVERLVNPQDPESEKVKVALAPICMIKMDIKDFFPSIKASWIREFFMEEVGYSHYVSGLLSALCTVKRDVKKKGKLLGGGTLSMSKVTSGFYTQDVKFLHSAETRDYRVVFSGGSKDTRWKTIEKTYGGFRVQCSVGGGNDETVTWKAYKNETLEVRHLPQGSPLSGSLANLVGFHRFGKKIKKLLDDHSPDWVFTIYSDDIVITHPSLTLSDEDASYIVKSMRDIITDSGFKVNEKKTLVRRSDRGIHNKIKILGCIVTDKINVPKEYKNKIGSMIHKCSTEGFESQCNTKQTVLGLVSYLKGSIEYIKSIRPDVGSKMTGSLQEAMDAHSIDMVPDELEGNLF